MKTRNYKTIKLGSKCRNGQGIDPTYAHAAKFGKLASEQAKIMDRIEGQIYNALRREAKQADRVRRKAEKHLDWDFVRELLDMGLTLEQAKIESEY